MTNIPTTVAATAIPAMAPEDNSLVDFCSADGEAPVVVAADGESDDERGETERQFIAVVASPHVAEGW